MIPNLEGLGEYQFCLFKSIVRRRQAHIATHFSRETRSRLHLWLLRLQSRLILLFLWKLHLPEGVAYKTCPRMFLVHFLSSFSRLPASVVVKITSMMFMVNVYFGRGTCGMLVRNRTFFFNQFLHNGIASLPDTHAGQHSCSISLFCNACY